MRKVIINLALFALLLAPTAVWAQGTLRVMSVHGNVSWKAASSRSFVPVSLTTNVPQAIQVGDELQTGPDADIMLQVPDGSYVAVSENSKFTVQDFWSGNLRSIMNLMVGRVHFYIKKLGGQPNPYSVKTPTALIAVRGTEFDVIVDSEKSTEVRCTEGRVTVENAAGEEVLLNPGFKTFVRAGERPFMPIVIDAPMNRNRVATIHLKKTLDGDANGNGSADSLTPDNDRRNRISSPVVNPSSPTIDSPQRAKPGLTYP